MAVKPVVLRFTANTTSLRAGMVAVAAQVKTLQGQMVGVATTSHQTSQAAGKAFLGLGVAVAAGMALATRSAVQFEERMRNVATISSEVADDIGGAGDAILDMSAALGVSANQLAEGLYDIASSGFQGADGMRVLEVSAKAALAGLSTTAVAARAVTGALNAYGLSVSSATDVSDIFFQTVNLGVVTFEELAQNVGDFMGTANALGVALDEASAAFATITLAGVPAAEAATSLNGVMRQLIKPSAELAAVLGVMGYESGVAAVEALGLGGVLQKLREITGGDAAGFANLFPEIRATRGALAITANEGQNWARVAAEITDENGRAGATAKALAEQQKSLGFQLRQARAQIGALAIGIGQALIPVLRPLVAQVSNAAAGFASFGKGAQTAVAVTGGLGAGILTLGGAFLILGPKIAAAVRWFRALQVTAPLLANSLRLVSISMGVIGAVLAIGTFALAAYGDAKRKAKERTDDWVQALRDEKEGLEETTAELIKRRIIENDLDRAARMLGLSLETVVRAMSGEKDAIAEVNRAAVARIKLIESSGGALTEAEAKNRALLNTLKDEIGARGEAVGVLREEESVGKSVTAVLGDMTDATEDQTQASLDAAAATDEMVRMFHDALDVGSVYSDGLRSVQERERTERKKTADVVRDTARDARDAMDERHRREREALDDFIDVEGGARDELDKRQEAEKVAADATVEAEERRAEAVEGATTRSVLSMAEYRKLIEERTRDTLNWMRNLATIAARGGGDFTDELAALGPEAASLVAEIATTSDREFDNFARTMRAGSGDAVDAAQAEFNLLPTALSVITRMSGQQAAAALLEGFRTGLVPIADIIKQALSMEWTMVPSATGPAGEVQFRPLGGAGAVATLAEGRVTRSPQIRSTPVLWAEAGPEAYIPLGQHHAARSAALTAQVAAHFGYGLVPMADGGLWALPGGSGGAGMGAALTALHRAVSALQSDSGRRRPVHMENHFPQDIDPVHVGRRIAWQIT